MNPKIRKILYYVIAIFVLINVFIWDKALEEQETNLASFSVNFLDVGQGDAILIQTPDQEQILIDGGPDYDDLIDDLEEVMPGNDKKIETIILTHPDKDHLAGLIEVIDKYETELILDNQIAHESSLAKDWQNKIQNLTVKPIYAGESLKYRFEDKDIFELKFLWPISPKQAQTITDTNDTSIVVKLSFENQTFLLTGDASKEIEDKLLQIYEADSLQSNILKAGHHGSKNSTSEEFIEAVNPRYSVISCGENNTYGHPHEEAIKNLSKSTILRTDEYGRISFLLSVDELKIKCEEYDCEEL